MSRFPRIFVSLAMLAWACTLAMGTVSSKPNVIFILADDLGYGDLGCYGQERIQTPNIDALAAQGMRFTQFYAGSTVCAPSRCVLMTGVHTGRAEIRGNKEIQPMGQWPLTDEAYTVSELFQDAGYHTGLIGKWGLGGPDSSGIPNRQGFDEFFGYLGQRHAHNYYPEFLFRNQERVPLPGNRVDNDRKDGAGYAVERTTYTHDLFAEEALDFVRRNHEAAFFLYLPVTIPHANNEGKELGMEVPDFGPYADRDWPVAQKGHAAMITRLDNDIGRLMDLLAELAIADNTLVFFTSDNGPHREGGADPQYFDSNGPLRGIKRDLYEGGIRVPMIASWPGHIPSGTVTDHVGYFGDLMATAAELVDAPTPEGLDSISFLPSLLNPKAPEQRRHDYLYWEFHGSRTLRAIRQDRWKAILFPDSRLELYDLAIDDGETEDLAASQPEQASKMRQTILASREDDPLWPMKLEQP